MILFKEREAYFCNIKFLLILLVVLGHFMERYINLDSEIHLIYALIYIVHMPLFSFVSGYFSRPGRTGYAKARRIGGYFLFLHILYLILGFLITGKIGNWMQPYWYFWYLLSLFCWKWIGALLWPKYNMSTKAVFILNIFIILAAFAVGSLSGTLSCINRDFSLSIIWALFFPKGH